MDSGWWASDDGCVMRRRLVVVACIAGGLVLVGLGVWGAVANLDAADKIASVVGAVVGVVGLALSGYGLVLARRDSPAGGQAVTDSTVAGGLVQVRDVRGSVRIGPGAAGAAAPVATPGPSSTPPSPPPVSSTPVQGGQSVTGTHVGGSVFQMDGVGGDADVDR
jgi:hypothetical protein